MVLAWRSWCGLCGRIPEEGVGTEKQYTNLRNNEKLLEIAKRCFSISLERNSGFPVCPECETFLDSLARFSTICGNTKALMLRLRREKIEEDFCIMAIRRIYLEIDEEVVTIEEHVVKEEPKEELKQQLSLVVEEEDMEVIVEEIVEQEEESEDEDHQEEEEEEVIEEEVIDSVVALKNIPSYYTRIKEGKKSLTDRRRQPHKRPPRPKTEEENFKCEECGKNFWTLQTLKLHQNRHKGHNDPTKYRPYVCEVCGKPFVSEVALNEHRSTHSDDRPFQCPVCPRAYKTPQQYNVHLKTHSNDKTVCPECGRVFNTRKTYNRHKLVHSDLKKHNCVLCGDKFKRSVALKDHLMSHFGIKPYKCSFCADSFQYGVGLRNHRKKHHPVELAELEASGKLEEVWVENRNLPKISEMLKMAQERAIKEGIVLPREEAVIL